MFVNVEDVIKKAKEVEVNEQDIVRYSANEMMDRFEMYIDEFGREPKQLRLEWTDRLVKFVDDDNVYFSLDVIDFLDYEMNKKESDIMSLMNRDVEDIEDAYNELLLQRVVKELSTYPVRYERRA